VTVFALLEYLFNTENTAPASSRQANFPVKVAIADQRSRAAAGARSMIGSGADVGTVCRQGAVGLVMPPMSSARHRA